MKPVKDIPKKHRGPLVFVIIAFLTILTVSVLDFSEFYKEKTETKK